MKNEFGFSWEGPTQGKHEEEQVYTAKTPHGTYEHAHDARINRHDLWYKPTVTQHDRANHGPYQAGKTYYVSGGFFSGGKHNYDDGKAISEVAFLHHAKVHHGLEPQKIQAAWPKEGHARFRHAHSGMIENELSRLKKNHSTLDKLEDLKLKIEEARAGRMEKVGAPTVPPQKPAIYSQAVAGPEVYVPIGLRAIGLNESEGGKYLDHPLVKTGQMAGERAGGVYGMMPLTFRDVVNSDATLKSEYGVIASLSTDEITKALNEDTRMAKAAAVKYYEHLSADFRNDHIRVAYAWNHGPGCVKGRPDSVLLKDSYVQDYMRHYVKELARDKTDWRKAQEPKVEEIQFKPAVVTGNGTMALSKSDGCIYVSCDGDGIGALVEAAAMKNDLAEIKRIDKLIVDGQSKIRSFAEGHGGEVFIDGGDDLAFTLPKKHEGELEKLRESYKTITTHTLTIGVGSEISEAAKALFLGKLKGKNRIEHWGSDSAKELKSLSSDEQDEKAKLKGEGLLGKSEKEWPNEAAEKLHFKPGGAFHPDYMSRAQTSHGEYRMTHSYGVKAKGQAAYEHDPGSENHQLWYEPKTEKEHHWSRSLGEFPSKEAAIQHAHGDHVARHYGLSPNDVTAANTAWPGQGLSRFAGIHPDMVRSELNRAHKSYNMNKALVKAELQKMAIKDLRAGEKKSSTEYYDIHDYDHLLKPEHVKAGYGLTVWQQRKGVRSTGAPDVKAVVTHKGMPVGRVIGHVHDTGVGYPGKYHSLTPHSEIDKEHRGKGLGLASYEALYAHAKHKMGVTQIDGGEHTNDAGRVHEALASKHGLSYKGKLYHHDADGLVKPERSTVNVVTDRAPYRYALKSEDLNADLIKRKKEAIPNELPTGHKLLGSDRDESVYTKPHEMTGRSPNPHSFNISEGLKNPKGIKSMGHFSRGTLRAEHPRYGHVRMKPDSNVPGIPSQAENEVRAHDTMHLMGLGKHMHHVGLVHTKVADHLVGDTYKGETFSIHHELKDHSTLGQYHNSTRKNKKLPSTNDVLKHHAKSGDLHKLGVADYILGNQDRHAHNLMVHSSKPKEHPLQMIDHGLTLYGNHDIEQGRKGNDLYYPTYLRNLPNHSGAAHEKVKSWVNSIDAKKIHEHLKASGLRSSYADAVKTRISHVKHAFKVNNDSTEALRDIWGDKAHFKQKRNPQTYNTFGETIKPHFNTAKEGVSGNAPTS
jgi:hypothetical protein